MLFIAGSWCLIKLPFPWFSPLVSNSHNAINSVISTAVTTWAIVCDQRSWTSERSLLISGIRLGSGRKSHKLFLPHIIPVPELCVNHQRATPGPPHLSSVTSGPADHLSAGDRPFGRVPSVITLTSCPPSPRLNHNCRVSEEPGNWEGRVWVTSSGVGN